MDINRHLLHHTLTLVVLEINPIPRLAAFPDAYYTVNWQIRFEKPCLVDSMSKETSSLDDEVVEILLHNKSIKHLFVFSPIFSHFYMAKNGFIWIYFYFCFILLSYFSPLDPSCKPQVWPWEEVTSFALKSPF